MGGTKSDINVALQGNATFMSHYVADGWAMVGMIIGAKIVWAIA
jgi:hypothetical protein